MSVLTRAHQELFRRTPDECFPSLDALWQQCQGQRDRSLDRWYPPRAFQPFTERGLLLDFGSDGAFSLNDWSFGQLCQLAKVSKETVNRLRPETASQVFRETLPGGNRPLQVFTQDTLIRSIHGVGYTRLHNADLIELVREAVPGFVPPQQAVTGGTGLYCGEQDLFAFLIDPTGWIEVNDEAFAPGFFLWNSEVGKRSVGVETFWFQAVCANHLVWDAVEAVSFSRKHTAKVQDSVKEIRQAIESLVAKRDERRDGFVSVIRRAMETRLGDEAEEVAQVLAREGISRTAAARALEIAQQQGKFTIFALVDALTKQARELKFAGERTDADWKAGRLLSLAA